MSRWNPYKQPFIIFSLIMVAVILRLFLMNYRETIEVDGVAYAWIAKDWIEGKGLDVSFIPPVYPLAIGFLFRLVGNYELSGRLISVVSGGLLILPVFLLSKKLYNKQTAYYAATLTLLYPILLNIRRLF
ncbi:glycosyltransferase family 39 protein [Candidatus Poribacteria bacterium]|nr:glycosyltransferase family 39 protein [Candidatus Poribacteria bacterium]